MNHVSCKEKPRKGLLRTMQHYLDTQLITDELNAHIQQLILFFTLELQSMIYRVI